MNAEPVRRYFDNAATSWPKPPGVADAVRDYLLNNGTSAGRGAYREAIESGRLLDHCRAAVRRLFGLAPADAVIFTLNCTDALNLAIKGLIGTRGHLVTTAVDHNSVLRPVNGVQDRGGVLTSILSAHPDTTRIDPRDLQRTLRDDTSLVIVNHASNVTGAVQPVEEIARICRSAGVPFLLDAAQTAGHLPINFHRLPLDLLALPGHKGLLGPLGTGVLCIRESLIDRLAPFREGGTGSASERPVQPAFAPDKFEAGSHNAPGIAGLHAALAWIEARGIEQLRRHELALMQQLIDGLASIDGLKLYGPRTPNERVGVFSVRIDGLDPAELSAILDSQFGVQTRSGLHCAPLAHRTIGTDRDGGTTRISMGPFTSADDVAFVINALSTVARSLSTSAA